jgi:acetylornithine deacetylase
LKLFELTKFLINLKSPTGEEHDISQFLFDYIQKLGFTVEHQEVSSGRYNIYAQVGKPKVVLSTHLDTVYPILPMSEDKDFIYGRGACDAKGILAAQIKAGEALVKENVKGFGLLFVVGEEGGSDGAMKANLIENACQYIINGEPTGNQMAVGSKGSLRVQIETKGKAAHSAYPEQGESAILKMMEILQDLQMAEYPEHKILGQTTINIGTISGGTQANVVPDTASSELMFRVVSGIRDIKKQIKSIVKNRAKMHYLTACEPMLLETIEGYRTMVASFATDIPFLSNWGKPFLIGPGSILDAHTLNEHIQKSELRKAVKIYTELVKRLLKDRS